MFLRMQKRTLAFLLALILLLTTFMSVAVFPASAAEVDEAATGDVYNQYNYLDDGSGAVSLEVVSYNNLDLYPNSFIETVDENSYQVHVTGCMSAGAMASDGTCEIYITNNKSHDVLFTYELIDITGVGSGSLFDSGGSHVELIPSGEWEGDDIPVGSSTCYLPAGSDMSFYIVASGSSILSGQEETWDGYYVDFKLSDFREVVDGTASVYMDEHADIYANATVGEDDPIEEDPTSVAYTASEGLKLEADLESGYGFLAWVDQNGKELSSENPATLFFDTTTANVRAVTYKKGSQENYGVKVPAYTNEAKFDTLTDALNFPTANAANRVISVLKDVDYTEKCTIPSGTTLLVPFDDAHTVYGATPEVVMSHSTPSAYKTLTMKDGSSLTVADGGSIELGGKLSATGQNASSWNGTPTGPDGRIHMEGTSKITVGDGGNLYAWGYIYGDASIDDIKVEALSGATVYEAFQIRGWRGGSASLDCANNGMFPFNQYYIQNIEVPLKLNAGAKEMVYSAVNASSMSFPTEIEFIGQNGMFVISDGYLVKDYAEATDRLVIESHADATLGSLSVSLEGFGQLTTSQFDSLPLTNNITIDIAEGTINVAENIALLPGTEMIVDNGAKVVVEENSSVYVMDSDQWGDYAIAGAPMNVVGYSVANGTDKKRTSADLVDADVDINGSVEVYGAFLTQENGSNVHSSGTEIDGTTQYGSITYCSDVSTQSINMSNQSGTEANAQEVPFVAANIKQSDGTYITLGVDNAGDEALGVYSFGSEGAALTEQMYRVTWYPYDYEEEAYDPDIALASVICKVGDVPVFNGEVPDVPESNDQYTYGGFLGWAAAPYAAEATVPDGTAFPAVGNADVNYYAVYSTVEKTYTVKWLDSDDSILAADNTPMTYTQTQSAVYPNGEVQDKVTESSNFSTSVYSTDNAIVSDKTGKAKRVVEEFAEWSEPSYANGVCTYKVNRASAQTQYLVLWVNEDQTARVAYDYYTLNETVDPTKVPVPAKDGYIGHWKNLRYLDDASEEFDKSYQAKECTKTTAAGINNAKQNVYVAVYEEVPDGFYIVGSMNSWTPSDGYKLVKNESSSDNEYYLEDVHFDAGAEFKVKEKGGNGYWYPNGDNNNCVIHEEGIYDVYFRPNGDGGDGWFYNVIFVEKQPEIKKHSLTLDGTIGVNFYVALPANANANQYTMDFSWGHKFISTNTYSEDEPYTETDVTYSEIKDGLYKFTLHVAPKELNDEISAALKYDGTVIATETYSGTDYAYEVLGKNSLDGYSAEKFAELQQLMIDMLNYCAMAQVNFAYNTGDLANSELPAAQQEIANFDATKLSYNSVGDLPSGMSYYGCSMNLGSETSFMVIFQNDNYLDPTATASYKDDNGLLTTQVKKSGIALGVNLTNIPAAKVTSDINLIISDGTAEYASTVNAGSYIRLVLSGGVTTDSKLQNVMKALYHYNQSAVKFFDE